MIILSLKTAIRRIIPRRIALGIILVSSIIAIFSSCCILQCLSKSSGDDLARSIAVYNLRDFQSMPDLSEVIIGPSYQMYNIKGEPVDRYDVKLISIEGADRGYMIVNLQRNDFPVPEFSFEGQSLTEQLRAQLGQRSFRVVWLSPNYAVAIDSSNQIIGKLGSDPNLGVSHEERAEEISEAEFIQQILDNYRIWRLKNVKAIAEAWHRLPGGGKKSSELVRETQPSGNYSITYAEGYDRSVKMRQIQPNTGANNKDYLSGCGPAAWISVLAWHNMVWTPEVFRGSQPGNNRSWGEPTEPTWDTYLDRMTMEIGKKAYLDNHDCAWVSGNGGITHDNRMKYGYNFIIDQLDCMPMGKSSDEPKLQKVYDCITLDQRPVVIKTPNHFCVAAGFWFHNSGDNHYILLKTGWSGADKWIKSEYLEKYWYFKYLVPSSKITTPVISSYSPVICTTPWGSDQYDNVWFFWLDDETKKIHYTYSADGGVPNLSSSEILSNTRAKYPPAVFSEARISNDQSGGVFALFVDEQDHMHLLRWEGPEKKWLTLDFPENLITTERPSICGVQDSWFTVAFHDNEYHTQTIATCRDLQRPNAWPDEILEHNYEWYWTFYNFSRTNDGLNIFPDGDKYILVYHYNGQPVMCIMDPDCDHADFFEFEYSHPIMGTPSFVYSNNTFYVAYKTFSDRIVVDKLRIIHSSSGTTSYMGFEYEYRVNASATTEEVAFLTEKCFDDPALGMVVQEEGDHPVLLVSWNDLDTRRIYTRLLSIDDSDNPFDYTGQPK